MLKKTVVILTGAATLAALGACARKRPVERVKDLEGNRFAKADFEDGREWLGRVTIVNNGSTAAFGFVGSESDVTIGSFRFTKNKLQYVTLDVGSKEPRVLNEWDVEHSDYHQKVSGGRVSNTETENDLIVWKDKKFFKVNWNTASISETASFPFDSTDKCWSKSGVSLRDGSQEVDKEHISFTLAVQYQLQVQDDDCLTNERYARGLNTHTVEYKYSFMPDRKSDYKPYVYAGENDPLFRKYGYFTSTNSYVNETGRVANTFLMNRWAPGKHTFYFAPGTPDRYKAYYTHPETGVFARTNKLFADAKIDLSFEVKDADTQKIGDIRYSFINVVEDMDDDAPFGYGPSTAHPRTGEILSANSTLWVGDLKAMLQNMKDKQNLEKERPSSSLLNKVGSYLGQTPDTFKDAAAFVKDDAQAQLYRYVLPEFTYASRGNLYSTNRTADEGLLGAEKRMAKFRGESLAGEYAQLIAKAEKYESDYKKELAMDSRTIQRRSTVWTLNDAMFAGMGAKLADVPMESIVDDIMYRVAIHEFGHNLNLRHNFYGSVDADSRKNAGPTTSVMEYLDFKEEIGVAHDWEPYDRAALLYAYSNGAIDKINESGDVLLYCTDEHVWTNPLCNRFDRGATPTEVLMYMINQYDDAYWLRNFRNGRDIWEAKYYGGNVFSTMMEVKKFLAFEENAFQLGELNTLLVNRKDLDGTKISGFQTAIQKDMEQSARLALAFYASVMKQNGGDRPFRDSYDKSSGALTRIGIADDKFFAMRFLMGDDGFALDPNKGAYALSFASKMGDKDSPLKDIVSKVISDVYSDAGDMYAGFNEDARAYFMMSASSMPNREASPVEQTRIRCFRTNSFVAAYGVPADLMAGTMEFTPAMRSKDLYFTNNKELALNYVQINGDFYVAGSVSNPLASKLIAGKNSAHILEAYKVLYRMTEGRIPECR